MRLYLIYTFKKSYLLKTCNYVKPTVLNFSLVYTPVIKFNAPKDDPFE